jgi:hypothetical protein
MRLANSQSRKLCCNLSSAGQRSNMSKSSQDSNGSSSRSTNSSSNPESQIELLHLRRANVQHHGIGGLLSILRPPHENKNTQSTGIKAAE